MLRSPSDLCLGTAVLVLSVLSSVPAYADKPDGYLGLQWLALHQHPDGHWSSRDYYRDDTSTPYALVRYAGTTDGRGMDGFDVGVTGLALTAYLTFGETHNSGSEFRGTLKRAVAWLLAQQELDEDDPHYGRIGGSVDAHGIYNHVIATMALSEALLLTNDRKQLSAPVQAATQYLLRAQTPRAGWRYGLGSGESDVSVTSWAILALKTARQCAKRRYVKEPSAADCKRQLGVACKWLEGQVDRKGLYSYGSGKFSPTGKASEKARFDNRLPGLTAAGVLARLFGGVPREDVAKSIRKVAIRPPQWTAVQGEAPSKKSKIDLCYWYFGTYAMFQHGGKPWEKWLARLRPALAESQILDGPEAGSWDPIGRWGAYGGRVYATAINCMSAAVSYRFIRSSAGSNSKKPLETKRKKRGRDLAESARQWLVDHQHPDGHWSSVDYYRKNASEPYALIKYKGFTDGRGMPGFDIGVTGLALEALWLGPGSKEVRTAQLKGLEWLRKQQVTAPGSPEDGRIGDGSDERSIYNHIMATRAFLSMSNLGDPNFEKAANQAVEYLLRARNPDAGWRYGYRSGDSDVSVTCWALDLLQHPALILSRSRLEVDYKKRRAAREGAEKWLLAQLDDSHRSRYGEGLTVTRPPRTPADNPFATDLPTSTAASLYFHKEESDYSGAADRAGVKLLLAYLPKWQPGSGKVKSQIDLCYWYAGWRVFQYQGLSKLRWRAALRDALTSSQIQEGPERGSWDPIGRWGSVGGRVYSTAMSCILYHEALRSTPGY